MNDITAREFIKNLRSTNLTTKCILNIKNIKICYKNVPIKIKKNFTITINLKYSIPLFPNYAGY